MTGILTKSLFRTVLAEPSRTANTLNILSGFATPAMAHFNFENLNSDVRINLIVGMTPLVGIGFSDHENFKKMVETTRKDRFFCSYIDVQNPPIHSKIYVWSKSNKPLKAFTGSANYTQTGFLSRQGEIMAECPPAEAWEYYSALKKKTIACTHIDAEQMCRKEIEKQAGKFEIVEQEIKGKIERVDLPLYSIRENRIHTKAGLNWGQRARRNPNEAYIPVPRNIANSDFFPATGKYFSVLTDDGFPLICVIAQQGRKGLETPYGNYILGEYFRRRLNVPLGQFVRMEDLERYGRKTVSFVKLNEEEYYLDFSRND